MKLNEDETWNETKARAFTIQPNSGYTSYTVDMSTVVGWGTGHTLRQLRLDPADDSSVSTGSFKIDAIYLEN